MEVTAAQGYWKPLQGKDPIQGVSSSKMPEIPLSLTLPLLKCLYSSTELVSSLSANCFMLLVASRSSWVTQFLHYTVPLSTFNRFISSTNITKVLDLHIVWSFQKCKVAHFDLCFYYRLGSTITIMLTFMVLKFVLCTYFGGISSSAQGLFLLLTQRSLLEETQSQ